MIVVADTSVILNLCCVQHEKLLLDLFGRVVIPEQVAREFLRLAVADQRFGGLSVPTWIEILPQPPFASASMLTARLDPGEAAAIALCASLGADALLIDESLGRKVAAQMGLRTIGILGVLLEARRRGLLAKIRPALDRLEHEAGFCQRRNETTLKPPV